MRMTEGERMRKIWVQNVIENLLYRDESPTVWPFSWRIKFSRNKKHEAKMPSLFAFSPLNHGIIELFVRGRSRRLRRWYPGKIAEKNQLCVTCVARKKNHFTKPRFPHSLRQLFWIAKVFVRNKMLHYFKLSAWCIELSWVPPQMK